MFGSASTWNAANLRKTCSFLHEVPSSFFATVVRSCPVLGQAQTPRRRVFPFAVIALAVLIAPSVGGANPSPTTQSLRAQDAAIVAKSRAAVLGLYSLDARLAAAQSKLASLRGQAHALRLERRSLRHQLAVAKRSTRISQARVAQRLRLLYEQDNVEPLEIVLGSTSLDEALTNLDNLNRAAGPGRGHPARARRRAEIDRPRLTRPRGPGGRSRRCNPRRGGDRRVARGDARAAKLVHRRPGRAASSDGEPDREPRRGGERGTGSERPARAAATRPWPPPLCTGAACSPCRDGLRAPGPHRQRSPRRLGHRRGRSVGDSARHPHDDPRLRRGRRRGQGRRRSSARRSTSGSRRSRRPMRGAGAPSRSSCASGRAATLTLRSRLPR